MNSLSTGTLFYRDTCTILLSRGPKMLVDHPRWLASPANLGKIEGKDSPNVRHLPMRETAQRAGSSDMLKQGANSKPVEVVGVQLTGPKLSETLEMKPKKTGAGQNDTRSLVQPGHKTSPQQTINPKRPRPKGCKFIQINLHHSKAATALLYRKLAIGEIDTALTQKS
jgi:hypothetical protein